MPEAPWVWPWRVQTQGAKAPRIKAHLSLGPRPKSKGPRRSIRSKCRGPLGFGPAQTHGAEELSIVANLGLGPSAIGQGIEGFPTFQAPRQSQGPMGFGQTQGVKASGPVRGNHP